MPAEAADIPPLCLPPRAPRALPGFRLPEGTCDTHIHVFGSPARYPLAAKRDYTPVAATLADHAGLMDAYGIGRAVLVQPSVYGTDNSLVLDTLARDPERLRAVAVIPPDLADRRLHVLDRAGVRGVRINRQNQGGLPLSALDALARRIAGLGWHIQLHVDVGETPGLVALAEGVAVPLVIDHFGLVSPAAGPNGAATLNLLRLVEQGAYVKLSAPYRIPPAGAPLASFRPLVERLAALRPDRLLWGSDWPHVACWPGMPDDGDLAEAIADWLPTPALRHQVLVANPARLYWGRAD